MLSLESEFLFTNKVSLLISILTPEYDWESLPSFPSTCILSGSILMRSAGCIVNDILDRKIDVMVERTKDRPIASGKFQSS